MPFFFIVCLYRWRSNYQKGDVWDPINWFNPTTFVYLSQARTWVSNVICHTFCNSFCIQWFEMKGGCLFCWYQLNCRPSLFKLSFNKILIDLISVINIQRNWWSLWETRWDRNNKIIVLHIVKICNAKRFSCRTYLENHKVMYNFSKENLPQRNNLQIKHGFST